jgi:hypothetical protein
MTHTESPNINPQGEPEMNQNTTIKPVEGTRAVVVIDRGWIFAGDVTRENGRIRLSRAVHVFRWEQIGFDGMLADPKSKNVTLKPMRHTVDLPEGAEIFSVPVQENWGL